jgi:hypothetical protein
MTLSRSEWRGWLLVAITAHLLGCGSEQEPAAASTSGVAPDGGIEGCAPGDRSLEDGTCISPGVPAAACFEGFEPDGTGVCNPVLPEGACPAGQMAVPGDAACRDLADCGDAPYGDAPIDASTQHVDGSYPGADSDGTAARPWRTVTEAVAAADSGALVAIAEGSYVGSVDLGKRVRLWGRCPQRVEIVGDDPSFTAIAITANEVEVHALAVSGEGYAVVMSGAENVLLERIWIHDTSNRGLQVYDDLGATSVTLRDSLVERTQRTGLILAGSVATIERSSFRDVQSEDDPESGWGLTVTNGDTGPATLTLAHVLVERNRGIGVSVFASDATIEASVLRDTLPLDTGQLGRGLAISEGEGGERANVTVRGSVVERNHEVGISVEGSDALIETSTVRDTAPIAGFPLPLDVRGIAVQNGGFTSGRSSVVLRQSVLDRNLGVSLFVGLSTAEVESVAVRDTQPQPPNQDAGTGIYLRSEAVATIRYSTVARSRVAGIAVVASEATIEGSAVTETLGHATSGLFGDGIDVLSTQAFAARATIRASTVRGSQRAGIGNFAGTALLDGNAIACNAIDIDGEPNGIDITGATFEFEAGADNVCGCEAEAECLVQTANLGLPAL